MIVSLRGELTEVAADRVVLEAGGVGYGLLVPGRLAAGLSRRLGEEIFLLTYLHVRDDGLQLFGFDGARERRFFLWLIGISGVGPKVALAILSAYSVTDLETAVMRGDEKKFESISGIGKKLAQRLLIELNDKVGAELDTMPTPAAPSGEAAGSPADHFLEARVALQNLGLSLREAEAALQGAPDAATLEELVRYALTRKSEAGT
jgi:Holliday junction DNA helicase RuvA